MYQVTPEMFEAFWAGGLIAVKMLMPLALWCIAAGIVNKGVG